MKNRMRLFLYANKIDADGRPDPGKEFGTGGELVDEVADGLFWAAMDVDHVHIPETVATIDH